MKTFTSVIALMLALLVGVSNAAVAAGPNALALQGAKVTQANDKDKTFTVMSKGKSVTFSAAKLRALPKVGEIIDITYTQNPGRPMAATTINTSKSNTY
jgi:hypothetical protein